MRSLRLLAFVPALAAACCAEAKPAVVAAQPLLADFVHVIAQDDVALTCLLSANADPHSYEPTPADLRRLVQADLVVVNGLGLEPWVDQLVHNSGFHGRITVASEGCPVRLHWQKPSTAEDTPSAEWDPHAWHDPANVRQYVRQIRDALKLLDPADAARFEARSAEYLAKIDELDRFARARLSTVPPEKRKLVTSHDSLQYLGHAYGLQIVPIAGSRPDQEPSPKELAQLITLIKREKVHAVFFEPTSSPALAQLVAEEARVNVVRELCTDGLGAPGTVNATYLGMFRTNIETIASALP